MKRRALVRHLEAHDRLDLLDQLLDYDGSGRGDLAANAETYLRELFDARRARRFR